jgi:hypothetical protein
LAIVKFANSLNMIRPAAKAHARAARIPVDAWSIDARPAPPRAQPGGPRLT